LGANYGAGPLSIKFGYEQVGSNEQVSAASADEKTTAYIIGAAYDLGAAKIGVGFQQANVDAAGLAWKDAGYTVSLSVPVSATTTFALGYATETTTSAGSADGKSTSFGAQAIYNWTKQVAVYGGAVQTKATDILNLTAGEVTTTKYAAGLRYNF
jgi:predicted porin